MNEILIYAPKLLSGLGWTILAWSLGCLGGLVIGLLLALLLSARIKFFSVFVSIYVMVFRGAPLLIQLFLLYSAGPSIGITLDPIPAGIIALALYSAAYFCEVFRSGIESVQHGQIEAGRTLGLGSAAIFSLIVFKPALVTVLPSLVNTSIIMLKESVILSVIAVPELMYQIQSMASETYAFFPALLCTALFYWCLSQLLGTMGRQVEAKLGQYRLRQH